MNAFQLAVRVFDRAGVGRLDLRAVLRAARAFQPLRLGGTQPPAPSWGLMLATSGRRYMETAPYLAIIPGLFISLTVLSFNMVGDAIRDVLDPRLRGSR